MLLPNLVHRWLDARCDASVLHTRAKLRYISHISATSFGRRRRTPPQSRHSLRNPSLGPIGPVVLVIATGSIIAALLLWIASFHMLANDRQQAIDRAIRDNANRAIAYELFVARTLDAARITADHLAKHIGPIALPPAGTRPHPQLLSHVPTGSALFTSTFVVDSAGNVRFSSLAHLPPISVAGHAGFQALRSAGRTTDLVIGAAQVSPRHGRPLLSLARPIHDARGRFAGAVVMRVPVERFTDFNQGAAMRPLDMIALIRLDGITLARREGDRVSHGQVLRDQLVIAQLARDPNGTYVTSRTIDGVPRIFSHRRLPDYGVFVTTGVGEGDVLAEVRKRSTEAHWVMSGITLVLFFFAGLTIYALRRRERAARDLAETNERLQVAQRIGGIGDWEYSVESDALLLSDQLCRMYGRDPVDRVIPREVALRCFGPEDRQRLMAAMDAALQERTPQSCDVVAGIRHGNPSHRRVHIVPVLGSDGRVRSLLGTEQDIAAEKAHEELRNQIAHLARVEAMNVMAATIAHELAQPLTAASNYLVAARFAGATNPTLLDDLLGKARDQIALTHRIVQRARDLAANRQTEGKANLAEVVEDAIALVRVTMPGCGVAFSIRLDPAAPWIAADKVQTQQVLLNLLRNACQAVQGSRHAAVEVYSRLRDGGMVELAVTDNGPGIPDDVGNIFAPFVSGQKAGLGLGLSICRTIVESYGGQIQATHPPEGARICFTLPLFVAPERSRAIESA